MNKCIYLFYSRFCKRRHDIKKVGYDGSKNIEWKHDIEYLIFEHCPYSLCNQYDKCPFYCDKKPSRYISKNSRYIVLKRQHWKCNICGKHLKYSENHEYGDVVAHIDHIHPFSEWDTYDGDINEISNLQALCPKCNMHKNVKKIN